MSFANPNTFWNNNSSMETDDSLKKTTEALNLEDITLQEMSPEESSNYPDQLNEDTLPQCIDEAEWQAIIRLVQTKDTLAMYLRNLPAEQQSIYHDPTGFAVAPQTRYTMNKVDNQINRLIAPIIRQGKDTLRDVHGYDPRPESDDFYDIFQGWHEFALNKILNEQKMPMVTDFLQKENDLLTHTAEIEGAHMTMGRR